MAAPVLAQGARLTHELAVELRPDRGEIAVEDTISLPAPVSRVEFILNAGLEPQVEQGELETLADSADGIRTAYRLTLPAAQDTLRLRYAGRPAFGARRSMGGMPAGEISAEGVYLDDNAAWYPLFGRPVDGLDLRVRVPDGWRALSIGRGSVVDGLQRWTTGVPHDEVYLIAGPFTRHARAHGDIELSVWLLQDDPALAERYLALIGDYIDRYSALIGPYPYAKFAVVENRWETGFGMPSFTLLGPRVMRLPFILHTSLPHEILHNWWGNGVWIDFASGNWTEGLTAYLADHWMQERQDKGDEYRLKALQRYTNFAAEGRDSPLKGFVSRHSDASQSIGYSKSMMLFHMLRRSLGDERFVAGLQRLWQRHRFTAIGFEQALRTLAAEDDTIDPAWLRWLETTGAPRLRLEGVAVDGVPGGYELGFELLQQGDEVHTVDVPVAVTLEGVERAAVSVHRLAAPRERITLRFAERPLRIDVDPAYDVLRRLDPSEQPAALNRLFGGRTWLVLPGAADPAMRDAWEALARQWQQRYPDLALVEDGRAASLPADANRLLLGWDNALLAALRPSLQREDHRLLADGLELGGRHHAAAHNALALVATDAGGVATGFLGASTPEAVALLARKLPHYGSYGRLLFDAASGENRVRDSLPSTHSALSRLLGDAPVPLRLAQRPALGADPR